MTGGYSRGRDRNISTGQSRAYRPISEPGLSFADPGAELRFVGGRSRYNAVRRFRARLRVLELVRIRDVYTRSVRSIAAELGWTRWKAWTAREELYRVGVEAYRHPRAMRAELERALEVELAEMGEELENADSQ